MISALHSVSEIA